MPDSAYTSTLIFIRSTTITVESLPLLDSELPSTFPTGDMKNYDKDSISPHSHHLLSFESLQTIALFARRKHGLSGSLKDHYIMNTRMELLVYFGWSSYINPWSS